MKYITFIILALFTTNISSACEEMEKLKILKVNIALLQGRCLDRLEDMHDNSKVFDPEFYFLIGNVNAFDDCIKIIDTLQNRECKADLLYGK